MPPEKHSLLGPSSAHRWLNCPPSARLTEHMPDREKAEAEEGRVAHALGELKLRKYFYPMGLAAYTKALKKIQADRDHLEAKFEPGKICSWAEMDSATDEYKDAVNEISLGFSDKPYIVFEQEVRYDMFAPDGYGTADCVLIGGGVLHVVDFKYGKGVPVEAEGNPQMRLYALGALQRYELTCDVSTIRMTIVQPRNGGISHAEGMAVGDLLAWATNYVKPRAELAAAGGGDYAVGDWCRFCKARSNCRARSDYNLALEGFQRKLPPLLTNDEVGDALRRALDLKTWLSDLEEYALAALLEGDDIAGWKAVNGRSNTVFAPDYDTCAALMIAAGYDRALLYREKPETLENLDTVFQGRKKLKELLGDHLISTPGKPTLAQENDNRPAITNRPTAEADFGASA